MGSSTGAAAAVLLCLALSVVAAEEPHFISMEALKGIEASSSSSRKLVGLPPGFCPVRFDEVQQMSKIKAMCRGQEVPKPECCKAFKDFACPYSTLLDNLTNGCALELLMKVRSFCNVPREFFASCGDSDVGLTCPAS